MAILFISLARRFEDAFQPDGVTVMVGFRSECKAEPQYPIPAKATLEGGGKQLDTRVLLILLIWLLATATGTATLLAALLSLIVATMQSWAVATVLRIISAGVRPRACAAERRLLVLRVRQSALVFNARQASLYVIKF